MAHPRKWGTSIAPAPSELTHTYPTYNWGYNHLPSGMSHKVLNTFLSLLVRFCGGTTQNEHLWTSIAKITARRKGCRAESHCCLDSSFIFRVKTWPQRPWLKGTMMVATLMLVNVGRVTVVISSNDIHSLGGPQYWTFAMEKDYLTAGRGPPGSKLVCNPI